MDKLNKYAWKFSTIGGVTRVIINSGDDIAHLGELDQKLWSVLSCPVSGLEFDEQTLRMMDTDNDGRIRVNEVVATAQWLTGILRNNDDLLKGEDHISFTQINGDNDDGSKLLESARRTLAKAGEADKEEVSLADVATVMADLEAKRKERDAATAALLADQPPYGDNTDDAVETINALREKVADYFMRCKLIAFNEGCAEAVDVSVEKIQSISDNNLAQCGDQIANYPIAHPNKEGLLPVGAGINPAWQSAFEKAKTLALDVDYPDATSINEAQWAAVTAKLDAYVAQKNDLQTANVEAFDKALGEEDEDLNLVNRFLHCYRDLYQLLKNYVVLADFYSRDESKLAVFQCGKLYIDQRCCELCIKVTDMAQQAAMAPLSGMYLLYCKCTSKVKNATMDIVAALTDGDVDDLRVGKNAVFYDRSGQDWDATVTKIIDNPISVRQAFWSPYKKLWNFITEKINKNAADKEKSSMENLTAKTDTAMTDAQTKMAASKDAAAAPAAPAAPADGKKGVFDIAKFAGIFAAIGMAVGFIGSALVALGKAIFSDWYVLPIMIVGVLLVISGPSMFIAWTKLRKRNIGPILNANGWAVNAQARINTRFGSTLTSLAKYPKVTVPDPYADKKTPWWKKAFWWLVVLGAIFCALYFTNTLKYVGLPFHKEEPVAEQQEVPAEATEATEAPAEAVAPVVETLAAEE